MYTCRIKKRLVLLLFFAFTFFIFKNIKVYCQDIWTSENSPYYVNSDTIVSDLMIEPGVEVLFTDNSSLTVNGYFSAIGAQNDSIYFKPAPGNSNGWNGIIFNSSSADLKLDFCSVTGGSASGITVNSGFVTITNSVSSDNSGRGLNVVNGTVTVINSIFKNNGSYGIYLGSTTNVTLYAVRISNNDSYGISSPDGALTAYNTIIDHNSGYGLYTSTGIITLRNLVISDNNTGLVPQNGTVNISNSIIYANGAQSIVPGGGTISVLYSDIQGGYSGTGNINQDPKFTGNNYELSEEENSPCIDAGNIDNLYDDLYFPPSKGSNINDMGAYGGGDACRWYYPLYTDPDTINYGNVDYNDSVSEFITIKNYSGEILNLDSILMVGTNKDKFRVVYMPGSFPVILAKNESREFEIEFTPGMAYASPYEAQLNFKSENGTKAVHLEGRGVQADIFIDPEIEENGYNFGNIDVGDSAVFDLIIRNFGTGTLRVYDYTPPDGSVSIENFMAFELAPNPALSDTLVVKFKPFKADTLDDYLIILSNDPENSGSLPIALSGIAMAPEITADQENIDFEEIDVFTTKSSRITLNNIGNKDLIVTKTFLSGPDTDQFNLITEIDSDTILIPEVSMDLDLEFIPNIRAVLSSTLNITSNDPNTDTLKIPLHGRSVAADLVVSLENIDFGDILISKREQIDVIIKNAGEKPLQVDTLYLQNGDSSNFNLITDETSFYIEQNSDSQSIQIQFAPEDEEPSSDQLVIVSNDYLDDTLRIEIRGQGVTPHIAYGSNILDFNDVWLGESINLAKIINNEGSTTLKIKNIQITGENASRFIIDADIDSLIIPPEESDSLKIRYTPRTLGTDSAHLQFTSNDLEKPNISIALSGRGVAAYISSDTCLVFGNVKSDSSVTRSLKFANAGNTHLEIQQLLIKGTGHDAFHVQNLSLPIIVEPENESDDVTIVFDPDERMKSNAMLNIISNAHQQDTLKIKLQATSNVAGVPYLFLYDDSIHTIGNAVITGDSLFPLNIENISDDAKLEIYNIEISGSDYSSFSIESADIPFEIGPLSSSNQRKLIFSPMELRTYTCSLTIYSNDTIASPNIYTIQASGIFDQTPPQILIDTLATQPSLNSSGVFQAKIRDQESTIQKAVLFIRKTGDAYYDSLNLNPDMERINWSTNINSDLITEFGLEYYLKIDHGGIISKLPMNGNTNPAALSVRIPEFNFPTATLANDYQMISVPFHSKGQTLEELFGDELGSYDNTKYRIFDWDQVDTIFVEQKEMNTKLPPGKALYLITLESKQLNINDCQTVLTDEIFTIDLKSGWNMISIPFAFNILWSDIHPSTNGTDLKYWNGTQMINPTVLEPFKGYGFFAETDTTLVIPVMHAGTTNIAKQLDGLSEGEWYFQIEAQRGRYADRYNFAGVRSSSHDKIDHWDSYEAPGIGDYISLFFTENTSNDKQIKLCADYKNKNNDCYQFDFEYKSTFSGKTLLNLVTKNLPDTYDWFVIAREGDVLLPKGEISSSQRNKQYRLIVGNHEYLNSIRTEFKALPEKFSVSQNYPNPFNPVTKIKIAMPKEAYITADIYNILGERIKRIANHVLLCEGYHDFSWDGKNENNFLVSSGIYFFTFRTPNYVKTIKMILQR